MLLFIILVLVLSIPSVQTKLGNYVTKRLNDDFKTDINVGRVSLQFNGDVELKEVLIRDYMKDTLFSIGELNTSIISFGNLSKGKLNFGDIDIENLVFNLKTHKGDSLTGLDVFVKKFEEDNPKSTPSEFLFTSSDVTIDHGTFRVVDENLDEPKVLEFKDIQANTTNFKIIGPEVETRINKFTFATSRGVLVKNLSTNFHYTLNEMTFDALSIKTEESFLKGDLKFKYKREDMADFVNKVELEASFHDSEVQLSEINVFFDEFGTNQRANFNVDLSGTLNNLSAKNLNISTSRNTQIIGDINFKNIAGADNGGMIIDGRYDKLSSNYNDLIVILPNILGPAIPKLFEKVGNFRITGTSYITEDLVKADFKINTDLGYAETDLELTNTSSIDNANYVGNIILSKFNIGELLNDPTVGTTTLNLDVKGKSFELERLDTNIKGRIDTLFYNGYKYKKINVAANVGKQIFNGELKADDPNLKMDFNGLADFSGAKNKFDFKADVTFADLKTLNFITRDSISIFKGNVEIAGTGSTFDDAEGRINIKNTTYENQDDSYVFRDFAVVSSFEGEERTIAVNSPDIANGQVKGRFNIAEIPRLVENSVGSLYTNYQPFEVTENQYLNFEFKIYNQIASIIDKDLKLGRNTTVKGKIETDEKGFQLDFTTPSISYKNYFANVIDLEIDNGNRVYNTFIEIDSLHTGNYNVSDFSLVNVTRRDTLLVKTEFKGGLNNTDSYDLNLYYTINENNRSVVGFRKSAFNFKGYDWFINEEKNRQNKITFDRSFENVDISELTINQGDEELSVSGMLRGNTEKDINVAFENVALRKITPRIDSLALAGRVNGKLNLLQTNGVYLPTSDIEIRNLNVNDMELGNLKAIVKGDNSISRYKVDVKLQNDNVKALDAIGVIDIDKNNPTIDVNVALEDFMIDPLNPLGEGVINNIRGLVSGNAKVTGSLKQPSIDGELFLDNAGMTIPYLNVDYSFDFDSRVTLNNQRFIFNDVEMTDSEYFSQGILNGFIAHNNFSDWELGLSLQTDRLLVLNTEETEDELYYGTGFVSGTAEIYGPTDELTISVDGTTESGTEFYIPLNDTESFGDNSFITFLSPEEKAARARGEIISQREVKGVELDFDLNVNENALIEIVIDKESGSTIRGRGAGNLLFAINTNGRFNMWGDFTVFEGLYNFRYQGLVEKKLTVEEGNIVWEGEPLDATLNLTAVYRTNANPSVLLDTPVSRSIPVEVQIGLTGRLEAPEPDFNFRFPNVSSTIRSELDYRLASKEERDNQALFLLATGGFASGIGDLNISGTVSERLNGIINNIFGSDNGDFAVGVDVELGQNRPDFQTNNRVGLTLQTKLSDRVLINGKVGVPFGQANQSVIAGDLQIDFLLNEEGTLKATVFNRENSLQNFGEQIGYTQGLGISYNVEFDSFKELIQVLFKKNQKKPLLENEEQEKDKQEEVLPNYITIKEKSSKKKQ
ncbi:translocation/assembly module TamB domain-containing protein [Winogradskyella maritima]|uniref:Translocation/assembly module TamB domain-containing protein n=1 Tax=Winogradskyella maritima TaxID=1517766 RepID=A0ABV8AHR1_9FLAO|nr:translocation/assembly module TamB domain-containing protein [Winogradskyella maritima]